MKNAVKLFLKQGILLSPDLIQAKNLPDILPLSNTKPLVCDLSLYRALTKERENNAEAQTEGSKDKLDTSEKTIKQEIGQQTEEPEHLVLQNYFEANKKITIKDFIHLYNNRYQKLQQLLLQRQELRGITSINKVYGMQERETVSFIAMIQEKGLTKNNHVYLVLEDQTGMIRTIITKNNKEAHAIAKDLTPDEVIGVQGTKGNEIVFINSILTPDVPLNKELKKSPQKMAAVFIGDLHIGSKAFLKKNFEKFLVWINGQAGNEQQKKRVKQIKYLFILGDLVDGIGIYPNQEKELEIKDIYEQYEVFSNYLKQIPKHITIFLCPGNHDSLRVAEPQPPLTKELIPEIYDMENVVLLSSPSVVRIGKLAEFPGFDVLIYHGYSFPYYASNIESLRLGGGLEKIEKIMTYLMKKRHLAPTHGSTQYQLGYAGDPLLINSVPDFFVSGHIHRASSHNYKNITLLNSSCWISQTEYQEKRGLVPEPARAIYVDLHTRQTKILHFA